MHKCCWCPVYSDNLQSDVKVYQEQSKEDEDLYTGSLIHSLGKNYKVKEQALHTTSFELNNILYISPADLFHIQELSSMFVQVRTAFGLRLQYSWKEFRLYLQADELWKDDTVGLCGTFNGNIQDDFL